jgi:hypothetical protein
VGGGGVRCAQFNLQWREYVAGAVLRHKTTKSFRVMVAGLVFGLTGKDSIDYHVYKGERPDFSTELLSNYLFFMSIWPFSQVLFLFTR